MNIPRTEAEALETGWTYGDQQWANGYASRLSTAKSRGVFQAGRRGPRIGQYYVRKPSWKSTRYYIRQYLIPPKQDKGE